MFIGGPVFAIRTPVINYRLQFLFYNVDALKKRDMQTMSLFFAPMQ